MSPSASSPSPISNPLTPTPSQPSSNWQVTFAILLGCLLSFATNGYQVGKSNHTVYLLDALRRSDADLLANDWFTTHTLQYHGLFSAITRYTFNWGIFEPVFLVGYLLTVLWFHWSAYRVVRAICGNRFNAPAAYLLSMIFLLLSAGGTGLGGFQFLQDGAFLPSNIGNVGMLAGIAALMEGRIWRSALCLGMAGLFHINHAVFVPWVFLFGILAQPNIRTTWKSAIAPALLVSILAGINILPALLHLGHPHDTEKLSLAEFVQIYAKLRHPHHYYPPAWPLILYAVTLWSLVPAAILLWKNKAALPITARRVILAVSAFLIFTNIIGLLFAGLIFISERLIQLAVFRFSILYIYLACALTAWGLLSGKLLPTKLAQLLTAAIPLIMAVGVAIAYAGLLHGNIGDLAHDFVSSRILTICLILILAATAIAVGLLQNRKLPNALWSTGAAIVLLFTIGAWVKGNILGLNFIPEDPAPYVKLAHWARDNTPKSALFLVPPQEQSWRYEARRAVVINLKAIPQTAAEMPEWKRRMQLVTGVTDLPSMAGTFNSTLAKLGEVYAKRPASELVDVAKQFPHCRYIVTTADLALPRIGPDDTAPYKLYDLGELTTPTTTPIP